MPHHVGGMGSRWAGGEEVGSLRGWGDRVVVRGRVVVVTLPTNTYTPHMVTMTSHMTVRSHRMGTTVTSSLHLMSIGVCVTVLLLLHGGHRDLMCHRYDWVVDLVRGVCPHSRS